MKWWNKKLQNDSRLARLAGVIPVLTVIAVWELVVRCGLMPGNLFMPPFSGVIACARDMIVSGALMENLLSSLGRVVTGLLAGTIAGIGTGILMGCSDLAYRCLNPIISLLFPIPALGWLPLLIIWIGIGNALPVLIIFICTFFPINYNTLTGIRSVSVQYVQAAESLGASRSEIFLKVILPLALPNIFTGLRLESGMAWKTVIAAEMIAIPSGIGALMMRGESLVRLDVILVCLGVLSVMSLLFESLFSWLEKRMTGRWL